MRALKIDATARTLSVIEVTDLPSMQAVVGGLIETAHTFQNGDTLFVNEEGLFAENPPFFLVKGAHQPFAGNGLIMGPADAEGETLPATTTLEALKPLVRFATLAEVRLFALLSGRR